MNKLVLRNYQQDALDSWERNEFKGIIEMATGTGKTFVGISLILKFVNFVDAGIVIVSAPKMEIGNQWKKDIIDYVEYDHLIVINSSENKWRSKLENALHDFEKGRINRLILITTYGSLENLFSFFLSYNTSNVLLVADEVHSFGSKERSKILNEKEFESRIEYRVGLSATPIRAYDEIGTDLIKDYFGDIIFTYSIGDAIKDKVLCPYNYYSYFVEMNKDEISEYKDISKKISKVSHYTSGNDGDEKLTSLLNKRSKIIKICNNKLVYFRDVINKLVEEGNIKYTFIFCIDSNQLRSVKKHLDDLNVYYSQITGKENPDQRRIIIKEFEKGNIDVLLSMGILDEGINIPDAKNAIILSSSTNPREYVQRRGRVLRTTKDENKVANIYDFLVIPPIESIIGNMYDIEKNIVRKELTRSFLFVKYSKNKLDVFSNTKLKDLVNYFGLDEIYALLR